MSKVVIIGTGTMGIGIAAGFLASGAHTIILGRSAEKALQSLDAIKLCADSINPAWHKTNPPLQSGSIDTWQDWNEVDLVIETVSEQLELKEACLPCWISAYPRIFQLAAIVRAFQSAIWQLAFLRHIGCLTPTTLCPRTSYR